MLIILLPAFVAAVAALSLLLVLYRTYQGYNRYQRAVKAFGKKHVVFINRAYLTYDSFYKSSRQNGLDSLALYTQAINQNPDLKVIIIAMIPFVATIICDPELIRKMTNEHVRHHAKNKNVPFYNELSKGLVVSVGQTWKKSRSIISNLFHFGMLKNREEIMHRTTLRLIEDLDKEEKVDLFKLGCNIGGEIVIESLFGKEFTEVRFGSNTPLEEIQLLITNLINESVRPSFILRTVLFEPINMSSNFLTSSQTQVKNQLLNIKRVGLEYIQKQKEKQRKGELIAPFIEAYLNLNDESYYDEIVQQLIIFLLAGQDTTGQLIEACLYQLAEHPQQQESITESFATEPNIHSNKILNNFINETLRMIGPAKLGLLREIEESFSLDGFEINKGQFAWIGFGLPMVNPKYFENPWEFKPDRWNQPLEHPNSYMPFSGGSRNCVGQHMSMMEVRIAIAETLKKYKLQRTGEPFQMGVHGFLHRPVSHDLVKFVTRA